MTDITLPKDRPLPEVSDAELAGSLWRRSSSNSRLYELVLHELGLVDAEAQAIARGEKEMRVTSIPLVASENFMSAAVALATACPDLSARNMESSEPGVAFYQGEKWAQRAQKLAITRATNLFGCDHANVQPFSGSLANAAIFMAFKTKLGRKPRVMSLSMAQGGHFTHGDKINVTSELADTVDYFVQTEAQAERNIRAEYPLYEDSIPPHAMKDMVSRHAFTLDYKDIERLVEEEKPDLIIVGGSAYTRAINFGVMKDIARKNGALLMADISHYSGMIVGGAYPSPFVRNDDGTADLLHSADIAMSTTHKSLGGPRGAVILWNDPELSKFINEGVFPGVQGEPHPGAMLGKAVAFGEAMKPEYKLYAQQVYNNGQALAETLQKNGLKLITGGTDSHMVNIDLRPLGVSGKEAAEALERVGLISNKMPIPNDTNPDYSGLRIGVPAATNLGLVEHDFEEIGGWVVKLLKDLKQANDAGLQGKLMAMQVHAAMSEREALLDAAEAQISEIFSVSAYDNTAQRAYKLGTVSTIRAIIDESSDIPQAFKAIDKQYHTHLGDLLKNTEALGIERAMQNLRENADTHADIKKQLATEDAVADGVQKLCLDEKFAQKYGLGSAPAHRWGGGRVQYN